MFGSKLRYDIVERAGWTGAEAALALLITDLAGIGVWWAAPLGLVLAAAKAWIAGRIGRRGTGSTLPAAKDPAAPPIVGGSAPSGPVAP